MSSSIKWRAEPEGPPKPTGPAAPVDATDSGPTLVEQLSFSSAARPFKNPNFTRIMSKRNKTLKQIVTTEREAALGLITSGKRKGKRPTAVEAAAVAAAGGVVAEPPFEITITGVGGKKTRLVGAAARAAQARQLREQKAKEQAQAELAGGDAADGSGGVGAGDITAAADDTVMEDAQAEGTEAAAEIKADATLDGTEAASAPAAAPVVEFKARRDVPSYFSVDAPPSLRPRKHYCDITGLLVRSTLTALSCAGL